VTYRGPSEAQINAEALARRGSPYTAASGVSFRVQWDYHRREPENLRDAVRMVRRAYADEVPTKLHEGYDSIGEGGTPKMTARAEGYLFGNAQSSDAKRNPETGESDIVSYYHAPFRATLDAMAHGNATERRIAAIVSHVTIGSQGPKEACMAEDVPDWAVSLVAFPVLAAFLRQLSDMKVSPNRRENADALSRADNVA